VLRYRYTRCIFIDMQTLDYLAGFLTNTWNAVATFSVTPFAEQPAAWLGVWAGCAATGLLIGWSLVTESRRA
jgi:hypothetical protein